MQNYKYNLIFYKISTKKHIMFSRFSENKNT